MPREPLETRIVQASARARATSAGLLKPQCVLSYWYNMAQEDKKTSRRGVGGSGAPILLKPRNEGAGGVVIKK